jgi:large subunit ribosomal protein L25
MEVKLNAEKRSEKGNGPARRLRASGRVPAVLYGRGMESVPLSVDARELGHVLHQGSNVLIDLNVGDDNFLTLAKDLNRDHIKGRYIHVDFLAIDKDQKITVNIPVTPVGDSRGVKEGGVLEHHMWEIEVECLPFDVPESVEIDVSDLGIGDNIHVSDLRVPSGVEILSEPEELVLAVIQPQAPIEVEEEAVEGEAVEGEAPAEGATEGGSGAGGSSQEGGES